jgi:hypothetical protein
MSSLSFLMKLLLAKGRFGRYQARKCAGGYWVSRVKGPPNLLKNRMDAGKAAQDWS